jgi:hypothetical protein
MIKEKGNILPANENQERRRTGHLSLLVSEARRVTILPRQGLMNLEREGGAPTTAKSEPVMPKRQQNRIYKESSAPGEEFARTGADPEFADNPSIKREFMLTPLADDSLHNAVRVLSRATGASLSNSHFLRVMLKVVEHAMPEIERKASRLGKLKRPGNARDSQAEREEFEHRIAEAVAAALQSCPPMALDSGAPRKGREAGKRTQDH